ncbi:cupin domain-containing protein [Streptomyces sp. NBC_01803]|uniref:cupin domain-containing protein n=1 Tax=Streptomyces sp. NBC_01803 TaxID=2975946 RepID=UPI002DDA3178|nr:cupin domain-containing protein [Streptomyces sp. NBC_01803]WSA47010.1 cupin domain-containing protein [Streptomyces sp. NBC_01803]
MTEQAAKVIHLDDIKPINYGGGEETRILLRAEDTGGAYSFYEVFMPPGEGSLYHVHHHMDEAFYVIEGEFEIKIDQEIHKAPAGTLVHGPRGVFHSFYCVSERPGKMLCTTTPGGIEVFFEELSALLSTDTRPTWEELRGLGERHGIIAHPPQGGPHGGPPTGDPR